MTEIPRSASGKEAIDVARMCAAEGAAIALARFRTVQRVASKGRGNVVTDADLEVELRIKALLAREYPEHKILSEETAADTDASTGWTWVIDPIDGTKNYSLGIPFWCTTVALCRDGDPIAGVTHDAVHDERFHAVIGGGAYVNDARVNASDAPDVLSSVIGMDIGYDEALGAAQLALMGRVFPRVQTIRVLGSAALGIAYAAAGRIDLFTHTNVYPWDIAAGILLVRESGGAASDRSGGPLRIGSRAFAAGGRRVHDDFIARYPLQQGGEPDRSSG